MRFVKVFVIFVTLLSICQSYRILGLFLHPGKTHFAVFRPLLTRLSQRGHEVTVISSFPQNKNYSRYKDVVLSNISVAHSISFKELFGDKLQKYLEPKLIFGLGVETCRMAWSSKDFNSFLKTDGKFDVIITEFFNSNCLLPMVEKYKAPFIGIKSHVIMPWANNWFGNPDNPSYIPNIFLDFSDQMSFFERVENTIITLLHQLYYKYVMEPTDDKLVKQYYNSEISMSKLLSDVSLLLVNSHYSLNRPRPLVPNVIEIGGLHIGEQQKLPMNIEKWISESTEGVIYFSLGSMIKGHTFPEEKRQMFLRAFGRLPQRVLWKWENETMPGQPDNVMIQKWMPQFDILCHPNVKAFVSHSGLLGMIEAVHCGVPVIAMPQFGDQHTNAKALEASGGGVILNFREADEEMIYSALTTVLKPSFNKKAKELSARFKDRPLPPLDTAVYWVEYVARHGGAPHMRTAAVGMPLYQYLLLDVIAFIMAVVVVIALVAYYITRAMLRKLFGKSNKVKTN